MDRDDDEAATLAGYAANDLVRICNGAATKAGWWHDAEGRPLIEAPFAVPAKLMLIVSEISEAMEADRSGTMDDKLPERPGIEVELADALIRICDLAGALQLDLGGAVREKLRFNAGRPDHQPEARNAAAGKKY